MMQQIVRTCRHYSKTLLFLSALLLVPALFYAQTGVKIIKSKTDTGAIKPKIVPSLGPWIDGSKAFAADVKKLLALNPQLSLKDEKGFPYKVLSYELTWKKKDISDDIRTGKQKTVFYYVGGTIEGNLVPDSWKEEISNFIQKGEELSFNTILYFDPKRKVTVKAPSLVVTIL